MPKRDFKKDLSRVNIEKAFDNNLNNDCEVKNFYFQSGFNLLIEKIENTIGKFYNAFFIEYMNLASVIDKNKTSLFSVICNKDAQNGGIIDIKKFKMTVKNIISNLQSNRYSPSFHPEFFFSPRKPGYFVSLQGKNNLKENFNNNNPDNELILKKSTVNGSEFYFSNIQLSLDYFDFKKNAASYAETYQKKGDIEKMNETLHFYYDEEFGEVNKSCLYAIPIVNTANIINSSFVGTGAIYIYLILKKGYSYNDIKDAEELWIPDIVMMLEEFSFSYFFREGIKKADESAINQLKTAIISILVDSFAHNISAHSLAALKWWFHIRSHNIYNKNIDLKEVKTNLKLENNIIEQHNLKQIAKKTEKCFQVLGIKDPTNDKDYTSLMEMTQFLPTHEVEKLFTYKDEKGMSEFRIPVAIDYAIFEIFKFLRDKAGFWSGVTRDVNFGGESKNLYDVLWNDFASNSLYLGTIAHSEGINKINIHIELPDNKITINKNNAEFAKIDLSVIKREEEIAKKGNSSIECRYKFLNLGKNHETIRKVLSEKKHDAYFPGGVVGQHAFFTILENTLRNIKHYKGSDDWEKIQKNGKINLVISINPKKLMEKRGKEDSEKGRELFEIEVFLNHKNDLFEGKKRIVGNLRRKAYESIINDTGSPKLGGSSQDKICAAMLLNGTFGSVDKQYCDDEDIKDRNDYYYNSDTGSSTEKDEDYRSWIGFREKPEGSTKGILKKYFYLWKSEFVFKETDLKNENINRFKFLQASNETIIEDAREKGVIRIVDNETIQNDDELYINWLRKWLGLKDIGIKIEIDSGLGAFSLDNNRLCFLENNYRLDYTLRLKHGNEKEGCDKKINLRNHGVLLKEFFDCQFDKISKKILLERFDLPKENTKKSNRNFIKGKIFDIIETVATKIVIFDDRLFERFESKKRRKRKTIKDQLCIKFFEESQIKWTCFKKIFIKNGKIGKGLNFLVLHLSFIEKLKKKNGGTYIEENIKGFIESELGIDEKNRRPENFILVITTGRGSGDFWENLDGDQKQFVTFKPIESLLSALEDALILDDDFQVKYNICKVLFGS